jgi:hypothetical protein
MQFGSQGIGAYRANFNVLLRERTRVYLRETAQAAYLRPLAVSITRSALARCSGHMVKKSA